MSNPIFRDKQENISKCQLKLLPGILIVKRLILYVIGMCTGTFIISFEYRFGIYIDTTEKASWEQISVSLFLFVGRRNS